MSITEKVIFMCIQSEVKRSAQADEPIPFFLDSSVESIDEINPKRMSLLTAEMDETVFFFYWSANANFTAWVPLIKLIGPNATVEIVAADHKCGKHGQLKDQKGFEHKNEALITEAVHFFINKTLKKFFISSMTAIDEHPLVNIINKSALSLWSCFSHCC